MQICLHLRHDDRIDGTGQVEDDTWQSGSRGCIIVALDRHCRK